MTKKTRTLSEMTKSAVEKAEAPGKAALEKLGPKTLTIDATRVKTKDDADRFRGLRADLIEVVGECPDSAVDAYMHNEVLMPIRVDALHRRQAARQALSPSFDDDTGEADLEVAPTAKLTVPSERQSFLDQTAIALFARGRPAVTVYAQAEELWRARERALALGRW